eukprot:COSAG02_NODE_4537_length_5239_cov_3.381712_4_plen_510_part_00
MVPLLLVIIPRLAAHPDSRVRISRGQSTATLPWTEQCASTQDSSACLPTPTPSQARYQDSDFVALICYNMCTYAHNGDPGCDESNWDVVAPYAAGPSNDPATFKPTALNTTQWMDSVVALGASIAVLTAKHGCGFLLWPTKSTLPDGSPFGYNTKTDILAEFVDSAKAHGVAYGFYYSIMKSFYLCHSFTGDNSCTEKILPGQHNLTTDQYMDTVRAQATELWSNYGYQTEIWLDSADTLNATMFGLQPDAAALQQTERWCGTESGHPSKEPGPGPWGGDIWSLDFGGGSYWGFPNGTRWVPKMCDPQLFQEHVWFWEKGLNVRTLEMMIPIYHDICGRGMTMELDFAIDRRGLVPESHAVVYQQIGRWVQQCYGSPLAMTQGQGREFLISVRAGEVFDRFQLKENTLLGQRVRYYIIESSQPINSTAHGTSNSKQQAVAAPPSIQQWYHIVSGQAIGTKRIILLPKSVEATTDLRLRLRIDHDVAVPILKLFGVFRPCFPNNTTEYIL